MKNVCCLLPLIFFFLIINRVNAQSGTICDTTGNLIIYSNYNGGTLTINVDENIPDLKIGLESYCYEHVIITGTYAGNVTGIWWAGYNSANNNCATPLPDSITISGAVNAIVDTLTPMAPVTYFDTNGYTAMIMCYQCVVDPGSLNNTPAQVVDFFTTHLGGTFRYHQTQYACWSGTFNVSDGGNCCLVAPTQVSVKEINNENEIIISPNPSASFITITFPGEQKNTGIKIIDFMGKEIRTASFTGTQLQIETGDMRGIYFVQITDEKKNVVTRKIIIQ
jgi:hypothetical protein